MKSAIARNAKVTQVHALIGLVALLMTLIEFSFLSELRGSSQVGTR
jgi:hypothetical protein